MKIALTYTGFEDKHQKYCNWLQQGNEHVEIVTMSAELNNLSALDDCNGLVLSGGVDVQPTLYNGDADYVDMPDAFDMARDEFEAAAFQQAQQSGLAVLGICRGLQLINCLLGGSLTQDLGLANNIHKAIPATIQQPQFDKAHGLHIYKESYLYELAKTERAVVNSAHHQCAATIAPPLQITCTSDDGIAEGLEWKDKTGKPFLLCVQWHPERMFELQLQQSPLSVGIRNLFIQHC